MFWLRSAFPARARLHYARTDTAEAVDYHVGLTTTRPHFGGLRWWFFCPLTRGRESEAVPQIRNWLRTFDDHFDRRRLATLVSLPEPLLNAPAVADRGGERGGRGVEEFDRFDEVRLTGTIRSDQADPIAFRHDEGDILEQRGDPVSLR